MIRKKDVSGYIGSLAVATDIAKGDGTLPQTLDPKLDTLASVASYLHTHLDILNDRINGRTPQGF